MIAGPGLEQETFKAMLDQLREQTSPTDALERMRSKAWQHFLSLGLPTRKNEAYRTIKLRRLYSQNYSLGTEVALTLDELNPWILPECRHSYLLFINGHFSPELSDLSALPPNVVVCPLQEAVQTYGTLLNNQWARSLKEEADPFVSLNGALHQKGIFLYIPPKTVVNVPIQILHIAPVACGLQMFMPRMQVFAGARSDVRFVTTHKNLTGAGCFINQVFEWALDEGAHLHVTQDLSGGHPEDWIFDATRAVLKKESTFKTVSITEGSVSVRTDYKVALTGENAEVFLNGLSMLSEKREAHVQVWIDHQAPSCRSHQLFKTVLNDFSRSSFEGKIMVRQAAQKTEAFQLNKNLLLSDHAQADSKPNLEIFADDVKASHGATMGQLDPEQLFYMKTRGFSAPEAKNLLIYGYCEQVIEMINLPSLRKAMEVKTRKCA